MPDGINGDGTSPDGATSDAGATPDGASAPPQWFQEYRAVQEDFMAKLTGRLSDMGKQLAKKYEASKESNRAPESKDSGSGAVDGSGDRLDNFAMLELGGVLSGLHESAQGYLKEKIKDGASPSEVLKEAMVMKDIAGVAAKVKETPKPEPGRAATAAQSNSNGQKLSVAELVRLKNTDPERYKKAFAAWEP